jgi:hypothetical protein
MSSEGKLIKDKASDHIPDAERLKLWVRSGGRCAICNDYLLEDEFTGHTLNFAEAAHVVARSKKGPRGDADLPIESRNDVGNLMLLCLKHHKLIDTAIKAGDFPRDDLLALKDKHERRVRDLTEMVDSQETTVIRTIGAIRDAAVVLSREEARATVLSCAGRYPRFDLSVEGDLEVDLRQLPGEGEAAYWISASRKIDTAVQRLMDAVERRHVRHLSVFAFGRIPLLAYLGHAVSDKIPTDIYQRQRDGSGGWKWRNDAPASTFEARLRREGSDPSKVALALSLSAAIDLAKLPAEVDDRYSVWEIVPATDEPSRDLFAAEATLAAFTTEYRRFLGAVERDYPAARAIDIFPAVPVSAAVVIGREVMRESQPQLNIFDRSGDTYEFALAVNLKS